MGYFHEACYVGTAYKVDVAILLSVAQALVVNG